jgi:hypothetical protein
MKKTFKVLWIIALLAVIGFSMAACGGDDDGSSSDAFAGTWINAGEGSRVVASNGSLKVYDDNMEIMRGTYTGSGNAYRVKISEVNATIVGMGDANTWIKYSDLTSYAKGMIPETFSVTINGSTCTLTGGGQNLTYTKQP